MKQFQFLVAAGVLCLTHSAARAQNRDIPQKSNSPKLKDANPGVSLTAILQMQDSQIARLNRVYDDYFSRRLKQENKIAQFQEELRRAQSPASFNERKAASVSSEIDLTRQKVANDFLSARAKSLQILESVQRAQLESLTNDSRFHVRNDRFYQLFLMPVEQIWDSAPNFFSRPNYAQNRDVRGPRKGGIGGGTATYGVYGGYGYGGPQYGVQGGYGRGPIGVYGGIGRGGPTIGIGIGGIFGGRR